MGESCCDGTASILLCQESQQQRELAEHNYINYKEVIWKLQHQLDESRRKLQEYQVCRKAPEKRPASPTITRSSFLFQSLIAVLFKPGRSG